MATPTQLRVWAFNVIVYGVLPDCAIYNAYEKWGLRGCRGDAQITTPVRTFLDQDAAMRAPNLVYVQTLDGVVYLSGEGATDVPRASAEKAALEIPGVGRVVDTIGLEYSGR